MTTQEIVNQAIEAKTQLIVVENTVGLVIGSIFLVAGLLLWVKARRVKKDPNSGYDAHELWYVGSVLSCLASVVIIIVSACCLITAKYYARADVYNHQFLSVSVANTEKD